MKKLTEVAQPKQAGAAESLLLARFAATMATCRQEVACVKGECVMTFEALDSASTALALRFLRILPRGAGPVAVHLDWSPEMLVSCLAAAKAGVPYIPFDTSWPADRIQRILGRTNAPILVVSPETPFAGAEIDGVTVLTLDLHEIGAASSVVPVASLPRPEGNSPLYIMYTSGSTGEPKGVIVTHNNVAAIASLPEGPSGFKPGRRVGTGCSLGFDGSIFALWGGMLNGCTVVCTSKETLLDARQCRNYFNDHTIDYIFLPTSVFHALSAQDSSLFGKIEKLIIGGELPNSSLCKKVQDATPPKEFFNIYGPTECTVFITAERIERGDADITAGKPVSAGYLRIVNNDLIPLEPGEWGEILIGGEGVAKGYLNAVCQTEAAFIPDPENSDQKMYRTGDRGMLTTNGRLVISGRLDDQIKISGERVEPGEIKAALNAVPGVADSHVAYWPDYGLVAYVVADLGGAREDGLHSRIRSILGKRLPSVMVPRDIIPVPFLPLNSNGKVDARNLPVPAGVRQFRKEISEDVSVLGSFRHVLRDDGYTAEDTFLSCGGTSLSAARLIGILQKHTGVWVPLKLFSERKTVQLVEMFIESSKKSITPPLPGSKRQQVRL